MTMWNTSLVVLKKGALRNIKKYSGLEAGKCFNSGFIEEEFNLEELWRIPRNWYGYIKLIDQMDYGSWLYSCDRKTLLELLEESGTGFFERNFFCKYYKVDSKYCML